MVEIKLGKYVTRVEEFWHEGGRIHERVGGLRIDEIEGKDGLR